MPPASAQLPVGGVGADLRRADLSRAAPAALIGSSGSVADATILAFRRERGECVAQMRGLRVDGPRLRAYGGPDAMSNVQSPPMLPLPGTPPAGVSPQPRDPVSAVDQQKIRRTRTGLIAHDPAQAQPGYTLFTPLSGDGTVYLVDMYGNVVHTWRLPYRPGLHGHLLRNGHLLYGGKVMHDLARFEAWPRVKGGAVLEVDWSGRVLWEVRHPDHHHDARRLRNGNVVLLCS